MKKILSVATAIALLLFLSSCFDMRSSTDPSDFELSVEDIRDSLGSDYANGEFFESMAGISLENIPLYPMEGEETHGLLDPVPEPEDRFFNTSISFAACGDNLIHPNIYYDAYNRGSEEKRYDFLPLYSNIASIIAAADFAYINQETPMAGEAYGYTGWPTFNSPQQLGKDLAEIGFDIINIANNHMLDKGESGYAATLDFWHSQPVTLIGGYYNEADRAELRIVEKDGAKIALLAYTDFTNYIYLPAGSEMVVPYTNDDLIISDLQRAKELADFIIVSIHWGSENTQTPSDEQRRVAALIADNGADVILGSHSHCLQPLEWIHSEVTGKDVLCIYSLGNFASGQANPLNMVGCILTFDIKGDGDDGLCVDDVVLIPTVNYYDGSWYNTKLYLLSEYTEEIAATHGVQWQGYGGLSPELARQYVTNVIPAEFLPDYMK